MPPLFTRRSYSLDVDIRLAGTRPLTRAFGRMTHTPTRGEVKFIFVTVISV
jgi:hypothetical protein